MHPQKQAGLFYVGLFGTRRPNERTGAGRGGTPVAETYGDGTVRIGTDQNFILTGVHGDRLDALLAEDLLGKYSPFPGPFTRGAVACTGSEFCRYAIVETKERAVKWARFLDEQLAGEPVGAVPTPGPSGPREDAGVIRMHFSGCSASCAQPQIADIGFRGEVAHVGNHLAEAVDIGLGGSLGADAGFIDWIEHARPVNDVPDAMLRLVRRYQTERSGRTSPSTTWARRTPNDELRIAHLGRGGHRHLQSSSSLQAGGREGRMKGYRIREEMNGVEEPPGKTWFWELEAGVIDAGRCIQCGACVAVCPSNSIGIDEDTDLPELVKMCTGCSLCWDFCPRGGLRYEALWPPSSADAGEPPPEERVPLAPVERGPRPIASDTYWKITGGPPGDGLGAVLDSYAVRAGARPDEVQDGGVVSALLIAALAGGEIDGALVTRPSDDPDEPWKGVAHLATTAKEIIDAAGSYYNQTMALAELDLSKYDLPAKPRIAVVGTPCEIQGIRAMQARRWPTGAHRIDAVVLTIALLCTKSFDYQGLMLQLLQKDRGIEIERVSKVDVIRGRMIVEYRDGELAVDEPIKNFHGAALKGCDECADFLGRSADLSVGSVGAMDGWSSVLVRSERGRRAVDNARGRLDLRELDNPGALVKLDSFDKRVAFDALRRPFDPDAPLFIDYAEHVATYEGTLIGPRSWPTAEQAGMDLHRRRISRLDPFRCGPGRGCTWVDLGVTRRTETWMSNDG